MEELEKAEVILDNMRRKLCELESVEHEVWNSIRQMEGLLKTDRLYALDKEFHFKIGDDINAVREIIEYYRNCISVFKCTAPPLVVHQDISLLISDKFLQYFYSKKLNYRILNAPVKVVINGKDKYFEPDIIIVFDSSKIKKDGCYGAPDIIIEIVSKSTGKNDYGIKKEIYLSNGVKEYLIVDPLKKITTIYEGLKKSEKAFNEDINIMSIPGLTINIGDMLRRIWE